MSERRWVIDPALGLTFFVCVATIFFVWIDFTRLETTQRVSEAYAETHEPKEPDSHVDEVCSGLSGAEWSECSLDVVQRHYETSQDARDLNAQEWMAVWAKWMFVAAAAGTIVAGYGLVLLRRTWIEAKRAADITRDIGEAEVRAYLTFELDRIETKIRDNDDGSNYAVIFSGLIKNNGATPAYKVRPFFNITADPVAEIIRRKDDGSDLNMMRQATVEIPSGGMAHQNFSRTFTVDFDALRDGTEKIRLSYVLEYEDVFKKTIRTGLVSGTVIDHPDKPGHLILAHDAIEAGPPTRD